MIYSMTSLKLRDMSLGNWVKHGLSLIVNASVAICGCQVLPSPAHVHDLPALNWGVVHLSRVSPRGPAGILLVCGGSVGVACILSCDLCSAFVSVCYARLVNCRCQFFADKR